MTFLSPLRVPYIRCWRLITLWSIGGGSAEGLLAGCSAGERDCSALPGLSRTSRLLTSGCASLDSVDSGGTTSATGVKLSLVVSGIGGEDRLPLNETRGRLARSNSVIIIVIG